MLRIVLEISKVRLFAKFPVIKSTSTRVSSKQQMEQKSHYQVTTCCLEAPVYAKLSGSLALLPTQATTLE